MKRMKRRRPKQCCANPHCDFYRRYEGEDCRDFRAHDSDIALIPDNVRRIYDGQTIRKCGYCDSLWVDPFRLIGKIGWKDGREEFWYRGETLIHEPPGEAR